MTPAPSGLGVIAEWSLLVLAVLAIVTAAALLMILRRVDRMARGVARVTRQLERETGPLITRALSVAGDLEIITRSVRDDVHRLSRSMRALSTGLAHASEHIEDRVDEFNALMEVAQREAEEIFLDTASTVRGLRASARSLVPEPHRQRRREKAPKRPAGPSTLSVPEDGNQESANPARVGSPL